MARVLRTYMLIQMDATSDFQSTKTKVGLILFWFLAKIQP